MLAGRPWTLVVLLAVALATAGCSLLPGDDRAAQDQADAGGQSWIVVAEGRRSPSPSPRRYSTPSPTPVSRLAAPAATAAVSATAPDCTGVLRPNGINGLTVRPGPGRATVSWYHIGDPGIVSYRLATLSQRLVTGPQPDPDWQTLAAAPGCRTMTATVDGLDPGAPYVFSLDVVVTNYNGAGTRSSTIARSSVVTIG